MTGYIALRAQVFSRCQPISILFKRCQH